MRWIRFTIVLLIMTLINSGNLLNIISISNLNIRPDVLVILLVFFATNCKTLDAMVISFAIGFAADISGTCIGPYTITFGLLGSMISQMRKVVIMKKMTHQAMAIFFIALVGGAMAQMLIFMKTRLSIPSVYVIVFFGAVYSGLLGPFLWSVLSVVSAWLGIRKPRYGRYSRR